MTKKISELSDAGALAGTEQVEVNAGGTSKRTTTQDIADLGGGGDEITTPSVISGVVTRGGGNATAEVPTVPRPGADPDIYMGAGNVSIISGNITAALSGENLYLYGGRIDINSDEVSATTGGNVTITGDASSAAVIGGKTRINGGNTDATGASSPPGFIAGGHVELQAGNARVVGKTSTGVHASFDGGKVVGGTATGGSVVITMGNGTDAHGTFTLAGATGTEIIKTDGSSVIIKFNGVTVPITGVAVSAAGVHAALVTLGLITT